MWLDGKLHFCTGAHEQKAKNIEASPRCVLTTGTNSYRFGLDVVVEGTVARLSDNGALARLAQMWRDKLDWAFHVGDGVFFDSESAGVALVFAVTPSKILTFTKAPYSQTSYLMRAANSSADVALRGMRTSRQISASPGRVRMEWVDLAR